MKSQIVKSQSRKRLGKGKDASALDLSVLLARELGSAVRRASGRQFLIDPRLITGVPRGYSAEEWISPLILLGELKPVDPEPDLHQFPFLSHLASGGQR
jgi:hypothetical protein